MNTIMAQIEELNENFNELGEDLVLLESVVLAARMGDQFPEEFVESGIERVMAYIRQHLGDVGNLSRGLSKRAAKSGGGASSPHPGELAPPHGRGHR